MSDSIIKTKKVWVAWMNTNLTEGRGSLIPHAVCELKSTAKRLGKEEYVQGTDCPVTKETAYLIKTNQGRKWHVPVNIKSPSEEDKKREEERNEIKTTIVQAKKKGVSQEVIELLMNSSEEYDFDKKGFELDRPGDVIDPINFPKLNQK